MSQSREQVENAIDEARENVLRPLSLVIMRMARHYGADLCADDLAEVRDAALEAVAKLIVVKAATTPSIANQLGTIVRRKVIDRRKALSRQSQLVSTDAEPDIQLESSESVEAEVLKNHDLERLSRALESLRELKPRYYAAIYAYLHDIPIGKHLTELFGSPVSDNTGLKIFGRARDRLAILMDAASEKVS